METLHSAAIRPVKSSLKYMLYEKVNHINRQNALNMLTKTMLNSNDDNGRRLNIFYWYRIRLFDWIKLSDEIK